MTEKPGARLPEVTTADARGTTAQLYADIRAVTGAPMVNLVYRHLAVDGARLTDVWSALRPAFVAGRVERAAAALPPPTDPLPPAELRNAFDEAGVDEAARAGLAATLAAYERANRTNLLAFSALLGRKGPARDRSDQPAAWPLPGWPASMPPMMSIDEAPPETMHLLYRLARADPGDEDAFVPSLYRHLLDWPELLVVLEVLLGPCYEDGLIETAAHGLRVEADVLAATIDPDRAIAAASPTDARSVIDMFCSRIAEMLVIGRLLDGARLPAPSG